METSWSQLPRLLSGAGLKQRPFSSHQSQSPLVLADITFCRYYICHAQLLFLASDPLSVPGLWGCWRGKATGEDQDREARSPQEHTAEVVLS